MEKLFKLKKYGTTVGTEIIAGITTFFAMSYIIIVNPNMLAESGMKWGAVFLATIIAAVLGTLVMGLVANVPYAQAPAMGMNAFFVYTICFTLKFTWQQALSMVFLCGVLNFLITVTKVRKYIIKCIPPSLQSAIGGGIGIFIAYIGFLNVGLVNFNSGLPEMSVINTPTLWLFLIGLALTVILLVLKVKGAMLISIVATTLLGIPLGVTQFHETTGFVEACQELPTVFMAVFKEDGIASLFTDLSKLPLVLITIFSFSISDIFDTIGTFVGTGRISGIFDADDESWMDADAGFKSRLDRALFADATATSVGALIGTSNTSTYVESAAGIGVGGRTGLTSVVVAICFAVSAFFASVVSAVPAAATAPILVVVGVMMTGAFKDVNWENFEEAVPAFFAGFFMALCYSISYGIAAGFVFYCIVKLCKKQVKDIHPILWVCTILFVLNFILLALI